MNQSVKLRKAISYVVITCAVFMFLAVWPAGIFHQTYVSKSNELMAMESDPVNVERNVTQMFVAEEGELSAVDLYVCNDMRGETITFRLYDASYSELFNTFYVVKNNQETPGFVHIPVGYDLVKDQEYYFTLEGLSADMTVAYELRETSTSIVNGFMSYGGIELPRYNVIIRYEYSTPFVWWQVLLIAAGIVLVTAGVLWSLKKAFEQKFTDRAVKVQSVFRFVCNPLIVIGGLILLLMIFPGRKFGTGIINYAFYGVGILLLLTVLLFVVNYKREGVKPLIDWQQLKGQVPELLMAVCIAKVIWSCYEYMNGLYEIHHSFATRKLIIWFLLAVLCTFAKKEFLKIYNIVILVAAVIGSYIYAKPHLGVEEEGELYKLEAYIIVLGILVITLLITNIVGMLLKKKTTGHKISIPYVLFLIVFMGLMIAFRNARTWPVLAMVLFLLFYLRMWTWEKSDRILRMVGNGLILNFIYMVGYSLLHRPYHRYYYYRYGLGYHTVTMTSVYLTLILCAIFVRIYKKSRQNVRFVDMWFEWSLAAVANIYMFLTLSRTGYIAAVVMELFMIALFGFMQEKKKVLTAARYLGIVLGTSVLFFPIVFTVTRITPALVDEPVLADVEMTTHAITKGTPSDSILYTDIQRVMKLAAYKVLGMYQDDFSFRDATPESLQEDYFYPALAEAVRSWMDPDAIRVVNDNILLASEEDGVGDEGVLNDMTNGRIEIFQQYIKHWNLTGHEEMGVPDENGNMIVHAHNVFLQVIHDHGLITGVAFIIFGMLSFVLAMLRFVKKKDTEMLFTVLVILSFAVAGMAEWIFHLCNPFGISVFFVITPLLFRHKELKVNEQE